MLLSRVHGRTTCRPVLTTFLQPRHIPTQGYNITQSSAPDDGHMVARNTLSNYLKRNKEYKKWYLVGFSYPHWIYQSLIGEESWWCVGALILTIPSSMLLNGADSNILKYKGIYSLATDILYSTGTVREVWAYYPKLSVEVRPRSTRL